MARRNGVCLASEFAVVAVIPAASSFGLAEGDIVALFVVVNELRAGTACRAVCLVTAVQAVPVGPLR